MPFRLRPISVKPILSRLFEHYVVKQYLLPAICSNDIDDQFAFRPTGSTMATLIYILHHVTLLLQTNDYVRCLLVEFSKAFDTVNHFILIKKLHKLDILPIVINWKINFVTDRMQQVVINGRRSSRLSITRSIVQGSGLEHLLFLIYILDLRLSARSICWWSFAVLPSTLSSDFVNEFSHIVRWAEVNKLIINSSKTKEIVFRRPSLWNYIPPPPLMQIEQVEEAKLLRVLLTPTLSMQLHVKYTISILNPHLYL